MLPDKPFPMFSCRRSTFNSPRSGPGSLARPRKSRLEVALSCTLFGAANLLFGSYLAAGKTGETFLRIRSRDVSLVCSISCVWCVSLRCGAELWKRIVEERWWLVVRLLVWCNTRCWESMKVRKLYSKWKSINNFIDWKIKVKWKSKSITLLGFNIARF